MTRSWRPGYRHVFAVIATVVSIYFGLRTSQAVLVNQTLSHQLQQQRSVVRTMEQQNSALREEIVFQQSPAYVEQIARQQLGLMRPGDHVVQIRVSAADDKSVSAGTRAPEVSVNAAPEVEIPTWRRWLELIIQPGRIREPHPGS